MKKNILLLDLRYPYKSRDSGSIDTINYLNGLNSLGHDVFFCALSNDKDAFSNFKKEKLNCNILPVEYLTEWLSQNGMHIDLVIYFRYEVISAVDKTVRFFCKNAKEMFFTCDLSFLREERAARLSNDAAMLTNSKLRRRLEIDAIRKSDASIVVSEYEYDLLKKIDDKLPAYYIPLTREVVRNPTDNKIDLSIGFIGGFDHQPNVDAVLFFCQEIWPVLKFKIPGIKFIIAGSKPPQSIVNIGIVDAAVDVLGYVENESDLFDKVLISIAPLRFGAGQKGKVLSSLCHGVPVVGTAIALEGMGIKNKTCVYEANSPEEWVDLIGMLLKSDSLRSKAQVEAYKFAENRSITNFKKSIDSIINNISSQKPYKKIKKINNFLTILVSTLGGSEENIKLIKNLIFQSKGVDNCEIIIMNGGLNRLNIDGVKEVFAVPYLDRLNAALLISKGTHIRVFSDDDPIVNNIVDGYMKLIESCDASKSVYHDFIVYNDNGLNHYDHDFNSYPDGLERFSAFYNSKAMIPGYYSLYDVDSFKGWVDYVNKNNVPFSYKDWLLSTYSFLKTGGLYVKFPDFPPIYNNSNWSNALHSESRNKEILNENGINSNLLIAMNLFWYRDLCAINIDADVPRLNDFFAADQLARMNSQAQIRLYVIATEVNVSFVKDFSSLNFSSADDIDAEFTYGSNFYKLISNLCPRSEAILIRYFR